ncbi:MAG: hypothetical protein QMD08_01975 [Actinomycetota bacterium]|nr:hypothetical protein [Actinomycetota bacterium]
MMGPTPWYIYVLQYGGAIVGLLYPIALVCILFFALKDFKRLVDHLTGAKASEKKKRGAE